MAIIITVSDLPASVQTAELVDAMVDGANAKASRVAPCLAWTGADAAHPAPSAETLAEARLVLIGAIKRWSEAGSGAVQSVTSGPFGQTIDTRQRTGYNLWPSEIADLQGLCANAQGGTYSVSLGGPDEGAGYWARPDTWVPLT